MITGKTECGIRYAVKRSGSAVAYCSLGITCGTRSETGFHSGIAHFTEHTLFKGTAYKKSSVINGYLDKLGGELNAYTTKEEIVLHATVLKEDLMKASSLLMEIATSATFPENEVNTERGVVIDEIKSYKDNPAEDIYDRFEEKLFAGHPLTNPILGSVKSVKEITSEELRRFVKEKFVPEAMAFTIVADIDEKRMEAGLLSNILAGPAMNSILNSILREKHGWVYGVESSYTQYADTGILAISLGCEKENLDRCLAAIDKEILKLQTQELTERKLNAAKKQLLGQLAISSDNGEAQCLSMGKSLLAYDKVWTGAETRNQIEGITSGQIMEMACRIFAPGKTSRLTMI